MKHEYYMKLALREAQKAFEIGEIPIGAVIVYNDEVIAKAFNLKESAGNVLAHAELLAIEKASKKLGNWRLNNCKIYVTLEPCTMCASAIHQARINEIYYGVSIADSFNRDITEKIITNIDTNPCGKIYGGFLEKECQELLSTFFKKNRNRTNV